jgi:hypothetical protein
MVAGGKVAFQATSKPISEAASEEKQIHHDASEMKS